MSGHAHSVDSAHYPIPNIIVHPVDLRDPHYIPISSSSFDECNLINTTYNNPHFLLPTTPPAAPLSPLSSRKRLRAHSDSAIYDSCTAADQLEAACDARSNLIDYSSSRRSGCLGGSGGGVGGSGGVIMSGPSTRPQITGHLSSQEAYAHRRNIGLCRSQPILSEDDNFAPSLCHSTLSSTPMLSSSVVMRKREARSLDRRHIPRNRQIYKSAQDLTITRSASDSGYPQSSTEVDEEDYWRTCSSPTAPTAPTPPNPASPSPIKPVKEASVKSYCDSLYSSQDPNGDNDVNIGCESEPCSPRKAFNSNCSSSSAAATTTPTTAASSSSSSSQQPSANTGKRLKLKKYLQARYQQSQQYTDDKTDKNSTDDESYLRCCKNRLTPERTLSPCHVSSLAIKNEPHSPTASADSDGVLSHTPHQLSPYFLCHSFNGTPSTSLLPSAPPPGPAHSPNLFQFGGNAVQATSATQLPYDSSNEWRSFEDQPYLKDGGRGHHRRDLSPRRLARVGPLSSSVSSIDRLIQNENNSSSRLSALSRLKHPSFIQISSQHLQNTSLLANNSLLSPNQSAPRPTISQDPLQNALHCMPESDKQHSSVIQHIMNNKSSLSSPLLPAVSCHICHATFSDYGELAAHSFTHSNSVLSSMNLPLPAGSGCPSSLGSSCTTSATSCNTPSTHGTSLTPAGLLAAGTIGDGSTPAAPPPSAPPPGPSAGGGGGGSKAHVCRVCGRGFTRSDMLTRHSRLHTGQKPYECNVCSQVFSRSDHLHTHLRTHTGEKPYRCTQCSYAAPRRDMITRHSRIHAKQWQKRRTNNNLLVNTQSSSLSSNESLSLDIPNHLSYRNMINASSLESNDGDMHHKGAPPKSPLLNDTSTESVDHSMSNEPSNELGAKLQRYCTTSDIT